jgi:hypothetical protein
MRGLHTCLTAHACGQLSPRDTADLNRRCLGALLDLLQLVCGRRCFPANVLPHALATVEVANLLYNGGRCSGRGTCSCCLAGSPGRSQEPSGLPRQLDMHHIMHVNALQQMQGQRTAADCALLASKGGLLLELQDASVSLMQMRRHRAAVRGGSGAASIPQCADVAAFLGPVATGSLPSLAPEWQAGPEQLLLQGDMLLTALSTTLTLPGEPPCSACAPNQLLLVVEAACHYPEQALQWAGDHLTLLRKLATLLADNQAAWAPWLPTFLARAAPALSAFVLAAAQQLQETGSSAASAAQLPGPNSGNARADVAAAVLHAVSTLLCLPGGALHAPAQHKKLPVDQLLGAAESALRYQPGADDGDRLDLGVAILQVGWTGVGGPAGLCRLWERGGGCCSPE